MRAVFCMHAPLSGGLPRGCRASTGVGKHSIDRKSGFNRKHRKQTRRGCGWNAGTDGQYYEEECYTYDLHPYYVKVQTGILCTCSVRTLKRTSGRCVWLFSAWTRTAALQSQAKFKSRYSCSTAQRTEIPQGWRGDFCNLRNTHSSFNKIVGNTVLLCCYRSCECTDRINQAKRAMEKKPMVESKRLLLWFY